MSGIPAAERWTQTPSNSHQIKGIKGNKYIK